MPKRKSEMGLGRGLNALLGDPDLQAKAEDIVSLPITQIEPGVNQPRKRFDSESLSALTESIRNFGIIQPLTVRRLASGRYQIIAGERRWRAAREAGLTEVPVTVVDADDRKVLELGLIENLQRKDLNPVEEAQGYQALIDLYSLTQEQISQRIGKSRPSISNALRLLSLNPEVLALLEDETLTGGHGRALLALEDPQLQAQAAKKVVEDQLSVRQTESLVRLLNRRAQDSGDPEAEQRKNDLKAYLGEAATRLSGSLGRKVRIKNSGKKGRVELEYNGDEDLETLLSLLNTLGEKEAAPLV